MFRLPIEYLDENQSNLSSDLVNDLQLVEVYDDIFNEKSTTSLREKWLSKYTTDIDFLKETQKILSKSIDDYPLSVNPSNIKKILYDMKNNEGFHEKYEFISLDYFKHFNNNEHILKLISMYSITSPVLSLITPLIMLVIPFFILKLAGKTITITGYIEQLKHVFSMMPLGKLFEMGNATWDQRGFILFSVILYFVQIYQNTVTCYKFYKNSYKMVKDIHNIGYYCNQSASSMETFCTLCDGLNKYSPFCCELKSNSVKLREMANKFLKIKNTLFSDMGRKMKEYYTLYNDKDYETLLEYSFSFHEYIRNMKKISEIIEFNDCSYHDKKLTLYDSSHILLRHQDPSKNTITLGSKNMILSGPNACGKTTLIKSTMINIILSQQIGKGYYSKATIVPHDYLHCYINIPDTCDRDSLFQAEARRCKNIIESINKNSQAKHLCIFDELFSGTNPYEAIACATGYLNYLSMNKNVRFMLTTHYLELCHEFNKTKSRTVNYTIVEHYKLIKGITKIKGGIKVLQELNFPNYVIDKAKLMVS